MDVKVFKTFLEVAKTRHFGKAASNLFITQAAVSARIKQLEEFVKSPLFDRERNNIHLTSAGERLIPYAETMVRALDQAKSDVSSTENKRIQISIAATSNLWDAFLQNYLTVITDAFPDLTLVTELMNTSSLNSNILEGTLDVAFMFDAFLAEDVGSINIATVDLLLVSADPDQTIDTVFNDNYVYVDWGTQFASEHSAQYGDISGPKLITSTARIALDFLLAKGGSGYLPKSLVEPFLKVNKLYIVPNQHKMHRPVFANFKKSSADVEVIKRLVSVLDEANPQSPVILSNAANTL